MPKLIRRYCWYCGGLIPRHRLVRNELLGLKILYCCERHRVYAENVAKRRRDRRKRLDQLQEVKGMRIKVKLR